MAKIFKYNEFEGAFDLADYVCAERWEMAIEEFNKAKELLKTETKASAQIKGMVLAITNIFDTLFGNESSIKILGNTTNLDDAMIAFDALQKYMNDQVTDTVSRWQNAKTKYTPNKTLLN